MVKNDFFFKMVLMDFSFHLEVWRRLQKGKNHSYDSVHDITSRTIVEHNLMLPNPNIPIDMGFDVASSKSALKVDEKLSKTREHKSITKHKKKENQGY